MKRFIRHCKKWNQWRKHSKNYLPYKIHVFFNPKISPTYLFFITDEELEKIVEAFKKGFEDGMKGKKEDGIQSEI